MGSKAKALLLVLFVALLCWRVGLALLQPSGPGAADPAQLLGTRAQRELSLQVRLLEDPRGSADAQRCRALGQIERPTSIQGRIELNVSPCQPLQAGWLVEASGVLSRPQSAPHPLLAGPAERLARQGVWSQLRVSQVQVLARPQAPVAELRRRIATRLQQQAGPVNGGVLSALVLGSAVVPLPDAVRQSFRAAGLSHALAASGFHLSVLLGAVLVVGRRLARPPRLALAAAAMLLFLLLAGPQPSVLRAVGMGAIALLLLEGGRRSRPLLVLLITASALLLWRPDWLLDVGFQLSVAATAGLILTARPLEQALASHGPRWLAAAVAVPLAAMVWTLPLQLLHFGVVPLYAVPANLLAAPLLTPLTLASMALALVAVLLPAGLPLLLPPVAALAALLVQITQWMAALPMAQWQLGRPEPLLVLLLLAGASAALALPRVPGRWRWAAGGALLLVAAVHLGALRADQLLLVHQQRGLQASDLLVARHQGRAALISKRADRASCLQAARLAQGLGIQRFDWALLLDPIAPEEPSCWQRQAGLVQPSEAQSAPLLPGQRLVSPGLEATPLAVEAQAFALRIGDRHWLLLPDRQSLWAWQQGAGEPPSPASWQGLWLGFKPSASERRQLDAVGQGALQRWFSGSAARRHWRGWWASGPSGSLLWSGGGTRQLAGG